VQHMLAHHKPLHDTCMTCIHLNMHIQGIHSSQLDMTHALTNTHMLFRKHVTHA